MTACTVSLVVETTSYFLRILPLDIRPTGRYSAGMKLTQSTSTTRERLIAAMVSALQQRGFHGIGLSELLADAQVPKGVLYHYFPGGKVALAVAAISAAVEGLIGRLDAIVQDEPDPVLALRAWLNLAHSRLARSDYATGCPLAAVALESTPDDKDLRRVLAHAFGQLRERLSRLLEEGGLPAARAAAFSVLLVAAYEGALMQARVAGTGHVLSDTTAVLLEVLARELREVAASKETP